MLVSRKNHIYGVSKDERHNVSVDGGVDTETNGERRGDNQQVENEDYASITYRTEFIDNHSHNIRTSSRATLHKRYGDTKTRNHATDNHREEAVDVQEIISWQNILPDVHRHREGEYTIDSLNAEFPAERKTSYDK